MRCKEGRGITGSAISIDINYLLGVAHEHDMKTSAEKTCQNETTDMLWKKYKTGVLLMSGSEGGVESKALRRLKLKKCIAK